MRIKVAVILNLFLLLLLFNGFTGEARAAEEKKKAGTYNHKAPAQPKKSGSAALSAADAFYWDNAVLEPGDTVYCTSSYEEYWISLYEVSVNDAFVWRVFNPALDSSTGLPTRAYENYGFSIWTYYGNRWEWHDLYNSYISYDSNNGGAFAAGIYIAGNAAIYYAGPWKIEIWRNHEGNMTLLTTGYFTLIDNILPSVYFNAPVNSATITGRVPVSVNAYDNVKISKVEVWADNTTTSQSYLLKSFDISAGNPYDFTWATGQYPLGKYTLRAQATDVYSNSSAEAKINVMTSAVVGVVEMSALNSVPLAGVENPVFTGHFDANGDIVVDVVKPIGEFPNGSFDLFVVVDGYPAKPSSWTNGPMVDWKWSIHGVGSGSGSFVGWTGTIPITLPSVDRYSDRTYKDKVIKLEFQFYRPAGGAAAVAKAAQAQPAPMAPGGSPWDPLGSGGAELPLKEVAVKIERVVVVGGETVEKPKESPEKTYIDFISNRTLLSPTIRPEATTGDPNLDSKIKWSVAGNFAGDSTPQPSDSPYGSFVPLPPSAPGGRGGPLEYTVTASVQPGQRTEIYSYQVIITQDNLNDLRQEYVDVIGYDAVVPARGAFDQDTPPADYPRLLDFAHNDIDPRHKWWILTSTNLVGHAQATNTIYIQPPYNGTQLNVTSGYRCPSRNIALDGSGVNSLHQRGRAFDFNQWDNSLQNYYAFLSARDVGAIQGQNRSYLKILNGGVTYFPVEPNAINGLNYIQGHTEWP